MNRPALKLPSSRSGGGLARVLVVTPDEPSKNFVKQAIAQVEGVETYFASTAHEAIRLIQQRLPDVIIADVSLADLDGFRLCRLLKLPLQTGSDQIPVVLISHSFRDVVAEQVARKSHAFAFLKLPCELEQISRTVELALHRLLASQHDSQLLTHKVDVQIVCADEALGHTIATTLELDGWRTERGKSLDELAKNWSFNSPQVVFVEVPARGNVQWPKRIQDSPAESPVLIAMLRHPDPESMLALMENGADDYLTLPCEPAKFLNACRDARQKHNYRTMHREFEAQLSRLRSVSDYLDLVITNSHEAIFTCDPDGTVKLWNKGAERVYGYTAEEIIGKNIDDHLDPPGFTRKSPNVVRLLQQRGSMTDPEVERQRKGGEVFPVSATYTLIKDENQNILGFSVIERDVTPIKALESERIKSARLRAITQTAVTANDHINTPLGIILGYAQFLELKFANADAQDKAALDVIQQQVHKIKGIMNKLKLISDPIVKNYSIEGVTMLDLSKSQLSSEATN